MDLADLALAQPGEGGGQQPGHLGPEAGRDAGGPSQQEVAGDDGHQVPPPVVDALDAPPGRGLVHHVVVVQRGLVDQLHRDRPEQDFLGGVGTPCGRRRHGQGRSEPLAPRSDKVGRDLAEEGVFGGHHPADGDLEAGQILLEPGKAEHLSDVH